MPNFWSWLRSITTFAFAVVFSGCSLSQPHVAEVANNRPELIIDMAAHTATAPDWQSEAIDCSTQTVSCVLVPGRFALATPDRCNDIVHARFDLGDRLHFRWGPVVHLTPPSGGYTSDEFDKAYLLYVAIDGHWVVRFLKYSFLDPRSYTELPEREYVVSIVNTDRLFRCV